jgi:hypothetical protein
MHETDWNKFMDEWDYFHREMLLPYIKTATKEKRKPVNMLLTCMKTSLKWCRYNECHKIMYKLKLLIAE